MATTKAAQVRSELSHPIIDADGHFVEIAPMLDDEIISYIEQDAGPDLRDRYVSGVTAPTDTATVLRGRDDPATVAEWRAMPSWWGWQTRNTRDRATMHLPGLLHERLDEFGIDYALLYPSMVLSFLDNMDGELSAAVCRAVNRMHARIFAPYGQRMTVGALVPMATPEIAVAALEHAVTDLGLKTAVIAGSWRRPLSRVHESDPALDAVAYRLDTYGLDSPHDYDPFWQRCVDLGVAPVSHSSAQYHRPTRSVSSYVYNHIGGLGTSHESLAKSLFLGGVTHRFPQLRVGFLEGGVAWAASLYADLLGHWEKRNANEIGQLDPAGLDVEGVLAYVDSHGSDEIRAYRDRFGEFLSRPAARPEVLDEFVAAGIERAEDVRDQFVPRFYFGCEADDPLVAWAFDEDVNPLGARLRPILGSDISHWDVPDMTEPIEEAYEMVERGRIGEREFREFTFLNPARLHAEADPDFFSDTVVADAVAEALAPAG